MAKNASAYYLAWWWIDNLAEFDLSNINDDDYHDQTLYWKTGSSYDNAGDQYCLVLETEVQETSCQESSSSCSNSDDDDVSTTESASLAFGVINFIAIVVVGVVVFVRTAPVSSSGSAAASTEKTADTEMGTAKSSMH